MKRKERIFRGFCGVALMGIFVVLVAFAASVDSQKVAAVDTAVTQGEASAAASGESSLVVQDKLDFGVLEETGRSYTKTIKVENTSENERVTIEVSAKKYDSGTLEERYTAASDWIAFVGGVTNFEIAPKTSVEVPVRVLVPKDVAAGSQYALVEITEQKVEEAASRSVLVKLDVAGGDLSYGGELVRKAIAPVNISEGERLASVVVKNRGTAGFVAKYQAKLENAFGLKEALLETSSEKEVQPGQEAEFALEFGEKYGGLAWGIFRLEQRVSFVDSEGKVVEEVMSRTVVNVPWWAVVAVIAGTAVGVIFVVVRKKVRGKKKSPEVAKEKNGESGET